MQVISLFGRSELKISISSSWLHRNVANAKSKQAAVKPVKEQIDRTVEEMKEEMGVTDIRLLSFHSYSISHCHPHYISIDLLGMINQQYKIFYF